MNHIVYISGPYTSPTNAQRDENVAKAVEIAKHLGVLGITSIVPHRLTHTWEEDERFKDWTEKEWLEICCYPLIRNCTAMLMVDGWQESSGCHKEMSFINTSNLHMPIYLNIDSLIVDIMRG